MILREKNKDYVSEIICTSWFLYETKAFKNSVLLESLNLCLYSFSFQTMLIFQSIVTKVTKRTWNLVTPSSVGTSYAATERAVYPPGLPGVTSCLGSISGRGNYCLAIFKNSGLKNFLSIHFILVPVKVIRTIGQNFNCLCAHSFYMDSSGLEASGYVNTQSPQWYFKKTLCALKECNQ